MLCSHRRHWPGAVCISKTFEDICVRPETLQGGLGAATDRFARELTRNEFKEIESLGREDVGRSDTKNA